VGVEPDHRLAARLRRDGRRRTFRLARDAERAPARARRRRRAKRDSLEPRAAVARPCAARDDGDLRRRRGTGGTRDSGADVERVRNACLPREDQLPPQILDYCERLVSTFWENIELLRSDSGHDELMSSNPCAFS
jgi:hypothetical protein